MREEAQRIAAGPAGSGRGLEGTLRVPDATPTAIVVIAHPLPTHGGSMRNPLVAAIARAAAGRGWYALRFNFRGVGGSAGEFDQGEGEMADYRAALDVMAERYPGAPLWAAGFSFGSWVALETGAADPRVSVLIGIAPPVKREGYTWERTLATTKPKFFVQGDMDELCPIKDLWAFYAKLKEPKELAVIEGASHLFEGRSTEVGEALEDLLGDFD